MYILRVKSLIKQEGIGSREYVDVLAQKHEHKIYSNRKKGNEYR